MPTHRDHPWERDARAAGRPREPAAAAGPPPPRARASWRTPLAVAVVGTALTALVLTHEPGTAASLPAPGSRLAGPAPSVSGLHSRFVDPATVEVWGRTTAPRGTSVAIRLLARGRRSLRRVAPAARGRFYAEIRLPRALRGARLTVTAGVRN